MSELPPWPRDLPPLSHEPMCGIDIVDVACVAMGLPRSYSEDRATHILWEHTPWPMGSTDQVYRAVLRYLGAPPEMLA